MSDLFLGPMQKVLYIENLPRNIIQLLRMLILLNHYQIRLFMALNKIYLNPFQGICILILDNIPLGLKLLKVHFIRIFWLGFFLEEIITHFHALFFVWELLFENFEFSLDVEKSLIIDGLFICGQKVDLKTDSIFRSGYFPYILCTLLNRSFLLLVL